MTDAPLAGWFREKLLSRELTGNEAADFLAVHASVEENLPGFWAWQRSNLKAVAERVPGWRHWSLLQLAAGFCDLGKYSEAAELLRDHPGILQNGEEALELLREETVVCSAIAQRFGVTQLSAIPVRPAPPRSSRRSAATRR